MARTMTDDERRAFLREGTRTGHLATTRADGTPHVAPIWFTLDGDDVVFTTWHRSVKGRNLRRDGRAALSVDDPTMPYAFVHLTGTVRTSDDLAELERWAWPISRRYVGDELAPDYVRRNAVEGELLCRLTPTTVVAQDAVAD